MQSKALKGQQRLDVTYQTTEVREKVVDMGTQEKCQGLRGEEY